MKRFKLILSFTMLVLLSLTGCGSDVTHREPDEKSSKHFILTGYPGDTLKIASGSENAVLNDLIEKYANENQQNIRIDYLGSLEQMNIIRDPDSDYDAVWPASSIWINMANALKNVKHDEVTSISPVVFGIKESKAKELGFYGKEVSTREILDAIRDNQLKFTMTSATQSNSGASAYLAFLTALNGRTLTEEDLHREELTSDIVSLLSGVERSSGSSNFLVELFVNGDYDAMVNYEQLVIQANEQLAEKKKEPLYIIYPSDGLSISDSTLAYLDHGDSEKEDAFLKFEAYLLDDRTQSEIEKTGKRNKDSGVRESNRKIFEKWGADLDRTLNTIRYPKAEVLSEALSLYQSEFKKPSFTVYVLDYSGSMQGDGYNEMIDALENVLIPEKARQNLLLGGEEDRTYIIPFSSEVMDIAGAKGNAHEPEALFAKAKNYPVAGNTALYEAAMEALDLVHREADPAIYQPSIILLTDGIANGDMGIPELTEKYRKIGKDIPIYSIMFADSDDEELQKIAELTHAKVFDGRINLIKAFKEVRGYN